jgi:hypothetical protein
MNDVANIKALCDSARIKHNKPTIGLNVQRPALNEFTSWQFNTHCSLQC